MLNNSDWFFITFIHVKNSIKGCESESIHVSEKASFWYMLKDLRSDSRNINVYFYDYKGLEIELLSLPLVKINGKWKVL
jgi:hypothetical protein